MILDTYVNGILRERRNHDTRTYTTWSAQGVQTLSRAYTAKENADADKDIAAKAVDDAAIKEAEAQRALVQASIALAPTPASGTAWVQPTTPATAYPKDSVVTYSGKTWVSLTPFNVWVPGVANWREQVVAGYPAWVQPTGAQDAYAVGARVRHKNQNWESNTPANVWEPGVFGWVTIA